MRRKRKIRLFRRVRRTGRAFVPGTFVPVVALLPEKSRHGIPKPVEKIKEVERTVVLYIFFFLITNDFYLCP